MFLKFLSRLANYRWTDWCISGAGDVLTSCFAENIIYATVNVFVRRFKREARPVLGQWILLPLNLGTIGQQSI